ncbi:MAG: hypothetical protein AB1717_03985 [Pseudomonadota bacterium]
MTHIDSDGLGSIKNTAGDALKNQGRIFQQAARGVHAQQVNVRMHQLFPH